MLFQVLEVYLGCMWLVCVFTVIDLYGCGKHVMHVAMLIEPFISDVCEKVQVVANKSYILSVPDGFNKLGNCDRGILLYSCNGVVV